VGVSDNDGLSADGITPTDLPTWTHDDVSGALNAYADPYVDVSLETLTSEGRHFVVLTIDEFAEVPVLCKKDYQGVLRSGACYVRRRGRIESSEVPSQSEMRDLLALATEKSLRRYVQTGTRAGLQIGGITHPADQDRFARELETFE